MLKEYIESIKDKSVSVIGIGVSNTPLIRLLAENGVKAVSYTHLAGSFGGINLEDISAPRCIEIERRLKEKCDIPVFHDCLLYTSRCV